MQLKSCKLLGLKGSWITKKIIGNDMEIKNLKIKPDSATYYDIGKGQTVTIKKPQIESFKKTEGAKTMYWVNVSMFGHKGQYTTDTDGKGLYHIRGDGTYLTIKPPEQYSLIDQDDPQKFLQNECDKAWEDRVKALQEKAKD